MNKKGGGLTVLILTFGVFGILNTEMGVVGMLPLIADAFRVTVPQAGWTVTVFALVIAVCGPVTPVLFSRFNRKTVMLLALGVFIISNVVSMLTRDFAVLLVARAIPAMLHPVYVSMAFTVAAASVAREDAPKAVARVFIGVSAGMVLGCGCCASRSCDRPWEPPSSPTARRSVFSAIFPTTCGTSRICRSPSSASCFLSTGQRISWAMFWRAGFSPRMPGGPSG